MTPLTDSPLALAQETRLSPEEYALILESLRLFMTYHPSPPSALCHPYRAADRGQQATAVILTGVAFSYDERSQRLGLDFFANNITMK